MPDSLEPIRQQMAETRLQLSEKLESLEHQVSQTMQSTGTAVNATIGAVQDAVQSVSNAFDLHRQIERHPWLVLGGSAFLGYLAVDLLAGSAKKCPPAEIASCANGMHAAAPPAATAAVIAAAYESGAKNSSWQQLKGLAVGALIGIVEGLAVRAVPQVLNYLTADRALAGRGAADEMGPQPGFSEWQASLEPVRHRHFTSENGRSFEE